MTNKDEFTAENLSQDDLRLLGSRICLRRVKLGLTQRDLVSETYYERQLNEVESGRVAPSNDFLSYLADCLATTPRELLETGPADIEAVTSPGEDVKTAEQELALMNAHVKIETNHPDAALGFLFPYKDTPDELAAELKPVFYRLQGQAFLQKKNYREAELNLKKALDLLENIVPRNILQTEVVRNLIGLSFYRESRVKEALKTHQQCLEVVLQNNIENRRFRMMLYSNLANEHFLLGKSNLAIKIYKNDALPLAEKGEDDFQVGLIYWGIGMAYKFKGELGQAVLGLDRSVKFFQKCDAPSMVVQVQDQLGLTFIERKDYKLAGETLLKALELVKTLDEPRSLALIYANLAYLYQKKGEPERAKSFIDASIKIERELGDITLLGQALVTLAEIKLALGEPDKAFKDYEEAVALLGQTDQQLLLEQTLENYAGALKNKGYIDKALEIRFRMANLVR